MQPQQNNKQNKQDDSGGGNWIGPLIFLLVIGSQFVTPLLNNLSGLLGTSTTQQLSTSLSAILPYIIGGIVVLAIAVPLFNSILQGLGGGSQSKDRPMTGGISPSPTADYARYSDLPSSPTLPTGTTSSMSRSAQSHATAAHGAFNPSGELLPSRGLGMDQVRSGKLDRASNYKTPGFEPIIDGAVLALGVLAVLVMIGGLALVFWFTSAMP